VEIKTLHDRPRLLRPRHTFASWAIAGGVQLFCLARIMGTSVAQIDATYGHLLPDSEDCPRGLLDDYDRSANLRTTRWRAARGRVLLPGVR
jgi:hypothetical protein